MPYFVKKRIPIQAIQYTGPESLFHIMEAFGSKGINNSEEGLYINTLEGSMLAKKGDWIIQGIEDEIYPCKESVFLATYDQIKEICFVKRK